MDKRRKKERRRRREQKVKSKLRAAQLAQVRGLLGLRAGVAGVTGWLRAPVHCTVF